MIQAFICNVVAPKSLDELFDTVLDGIYSDCLLMDKLLYAEVDTGTEWTVPRWAKTGDIVFYMHSVESGKILKRIRSQFNQRIEEYDEKQRYWLRFWINHGIKVHELYGGKVFALGRVAGPPFIDNTTVYQHWKSNIYAAIDDLFVLKEPIDRSEFKDFISISRQSAITGVFGSSYDKLMGLIQSKNKIPKTYTNLTSDEMPLSKMNDENWLEIGQRYRLKFFLEAQFRAYFVDHFLRRFGDIRTFFSECTCKKTNKPDTFVDNLVRMGKRWLPVEVKLDVNTTQHLTDQLDQYIHTQRIINKKGRTFLPRDLWNDTVLVIDTNAVWAYEKGALTKLCAWDDVKTLEHIDAIRGELLAMLSRAIEQGDAKER